MMPAMWGIVGRIPKLIPDASSIRLFGPGVIEAMKAYETSGSKPISRLSSFDSMSIFGACAGTLQNLMFRTLPFSGVMSMQSSGKKDRLAKALRENLHRRKAQTRVRNEAQDLSAPPHTPHPAPQTQKDS